MAISKEKGVCLKRIKLVVDSEGKIRNGPMLSRVEIGDIPVAAEKSGKATSSSMKSVIGVMVPIN